MAPTGQAESGTMTVQSIDRAFQVLKALAIEPSGVTDLAQRVGLPKSTVSRMLSSLEEQGAVARAEDGGCLDHEGKIFFHVPLPYVQVEHEGDQGPLQARARTAQHVET